MGARRKGLRLRVRRGRRGLRLRPEHALLHELLERTRRRTRRTDRTRRARSSSERGGCRSRPTRRLTSLAEVRRGFRTAFCLRFFQAPGLRVRALCFRGGAALAFDAFGGGETIGPAVFSTTMNTQIRAPFAGFLFGCGPRAAGSGRSDAFRPASRVFVRGLRRTSGYNHRF